MPTNDFRFDQFINDADDPDESIRRLLASVADEDGTPDLSAMAAMRRLEIGEVPMSFAEQSELAEMETGFVNEFRDRYWRLEPDERRRIWSILMNRLQTTTAKRRVESWEAGLAIPAIVPDEIIKPDDLADISRELFLMPPRERSARRLNWLHEHRRLLRAEVVEFVRRTPEYLRLDPLLFIELARWHESKKIANEIDSLSSTLVMYSNSETLKIDWGRDEIRSVLVDQAVTPTKPRGMSEYSRQVQQDDSIDRRKVWSIVAIIGILVFLIRFIMSFSK